MSFTSGPGAIHPDLAEVKHCIETTEDAVEGDIRDEDYVPPFSGMTKAAYQRYLQRAAYFNLTERTLSALVGAMMRKAPVVSGPAFSSEGAYSVEDSIISIFSTILTTGRVGLLWDPTPDNQRNVVTYDSDDILNWSDTFVVLCADRLIPSKDDPFTKEEEKRRLVLSIDPVYTMSYFTWSGSETAGKWVLTEQVIPQFRGKALNFIPFLSITPGGLTFTPSKPPLHTLATLNIQHFNLSCTIAYGARFFALPKPYIAGQLQGTGTDGLPPSTITLGQEDVLLLTQGSSAGYMEFTNSGGMTFLASERQKLEDQMVLLGSRLLTQKAGVESVDALSLRLATETATLIAIIKSTQAAISTLLSWMQGVDSAASEVLLNTDLSPESLSPQQVEALLKAYAAGAITVEQLLARFYSTEFVQPAAVAPSA